MVFVADDGLISGLYKRSMLFFNNNHMPLYYILFYVTFVKKLMVTWKGNMVVKIFMKLRLIFHGINFFF